MTMESPSNIYVYVHWYLNLHASNLLIKGCTFLDAHKGCHASSKIPWETIMLLGPPWSIRTNPQPFPQRKTDGTDPVFPQMCFGLNVF